MWTRNYVLVVLLLTLLLLYQYSQAAIIFNVGLPRTGTTSFHYAVASLNLSSQHVAFNRTRYDLERDNLKQNLAHFRSAGTGPFRWLFNAFDAFSDTPIYGLIPALKKWYPDVSIVATHRSRKSWLKSMAKNPGAGASFLWDFSELHTSKKTLRREVRASSKMKRKQKKRTTASKAQQREQLFDTHAALLDKYQIPRIGFLFIWRNLTAYSFLLSVILLSSVRMFHNYPISRPCR